MGHKTEVEGAMQVEQAAAARQPSRVWEDWRASFLGDIDLETDTDRIRFAPTFFTPGAVLDDSWPRFTLTGAEMARLVAEAPQELREIFGGVPPAGDIESVSFEYRSVALTRSWLPKRLFQSRFWRLGAVGGELSDGAVVPTGRCPAYITALVFARRVEIRHRQAAGADHAMPTQARLAMLLTVDKTAVRADAPAVQQAQIIATRAMVAPPPQRMAFLRAVKPAETTPSAAAVQVVARPKMATMATRAIRPGTTEFVVHETVRPVPFEPSPTVPPPVVSETPLQDEVAILAFICRPVRRCPDPDPALSWA
jgi:hypothetical protein